MHPDLLNAIAHLVAQSLRTAGAIEHYGARALPMGFPEDAHLLRHWAEQVDRHMAQAEAQSQADAKAVAAVAQAAMSFDTMTRYALRDEAARMAAARELLTAIGGALHHGVRPERRAEALAIVADYIPQIPTEN